MAPGDFLVVCASRDAAANGGVPCDAEYFYQTWGGGFALANSEDEVVLVDPDGAEVDRPPMAPASCARAPRSASTRRGRRWAETTPPMGAPSRPGWPAATWAPPARRTTAAGRPRAPSPEPRTAASLGRRSLPGGRLCRWGVAEVAVPPLQLLPQHVLDGLLGAVAVVLEGQQDQPGGPARAPDGLVEDLGLEGQRPWVRVGVAVQDEDGSSTWSAKKVGDRAM